MLVKLARLAYDQLKDQNLLTNRTVGPTYQLFKKQLYEFVTSTQLIITLGLKIIIRLNTSTPGYGTLIL